MNPSALVFLDSPIPVKLAVAWPGVSDHTFDSEGMPVAFNDWCELAGVPEREAEQFVRMLFGNGICLTDGTTNEIALRFINTTVLQKLRPQRKDQQKTKQPTDKENDE